MEHFLLHFTLPNFAEIFAILTIDSPEFGLALGGQKAENLRFEGDQVSLGLALEGAEMKVGFGDLLNILLRLVSSQTL